MSSRKYVFPIIFFLALHAAGNRSDAPSQNRTGVFTAEAARPIVEFLAADSLMGRNTPGPGLDRAAGYLAEQFKAAGLRPVKDSYFQQVPLNRILLGDSNSVLLTGPDGTIRRLVFKDDFMPFEMTADKKVSGGIVFAGYGIRAPDIGYDDYAGIDARGKIVVALKSGPRLYDPESPFYFKRDLPYIKTAEKVRHAIERGAAGLLLINNPNETGIFKPIGFPWPELSKGLSSESVPITLAASEKKKIPVVHVGEEAARLLFGDMCRFKETAQRIDSTLSPDSFPIRGARAEIRTSTRVERFATQNVVGWWPGRDKNEIVVIGAHYDHVPPVRATAGEDSIQNGADDNASGTAGMVLVARAFARSGQRPKRSIVFIAFAGEEKGLWGSEHYTDSALWPLSRTAAYLNLDMIGRNARDSLKIGGRRHSPDLYELVLEENRGIGMHVEPLKDSEQGGSDHVPFDRKKIPNVFFHTGTHDDLHKPSDSADKIDYEKLASVADLCYRTARRAAESVKRPVFVESDREKNLPPQPPRRSK